MSSELFSDLNNLTISSKLKIWVLNLNSFIDNTEDSDKDEINEIIKNVNHDDIVD